MNICLCACVCVLVWPHAFFALAKLVWFIHEHMVNCKIWQQFSVNKEVTMMPFKLIYCIVNGGKDGTLAPSTGVSFLCPQMTLKEPLSSLRSAQALQLSYWKRLFVYIWIRMTPDSKPSGLFCKVVGSRRVNSDKVNEIFVSFPEPTQQIYFFLLI